MEQANCEVIAHILSVVAEINKDRPESVNKYELRENDDYYCYRIRYVGKSDTHLEIPKILLSEKDASKLPRTLMKWK